MIVDVKVPSVGESITEGTLAVWTVEDGGYVEKGDTLFELETEKASTEVPAPESGTVNHKVSEGEDVEIGAVAATIDTDGAPSEANKAAAEKGKSTTEQARAAEASDPGRGPEKGTEAPATAVAERKSPELDNEDNSLVRASSVARKVAEENGIDLTTLKGSGAGGRIMREDVEEKIRTKDAAEAVPPASRPEKSSPASAPEPAPAKAASVPKDTGSEQTRERMSTLRRRIAERLVEAQHNAAMLTTFNDADMSAVMDLRKQFKEPFKEKHGVGLGFMSFFAKAVIEALKEYPRVNAFIDGDEVVYNHRYHIGVAVSTDRGLVVPVIRNAQDMTFAEIENAVIDFATRARDGKLGIDEMKGGTFTITNGGVFGSMLSTPILNPPQSGILGMHRIEQRPVAVNGEVVVRPMMYLALSYDHRIIDGKEAVGFLVRVKECIENPSRMLLEV